MFSENHSCCFILGAAMNKSTEAAFKLYTSDATKSVRDESLTEGEKKFKSPPDGLAEVEASSQLRFTEDDRIHEVLDSTYPEAVQILCTLSSYT